jgi:L-ascorbate metabolism protein UlaG (beta-lactamase superfamily)
VKIQHLRNATLVISAGNHRLLVDPMLSKPGTMPGFKMIGGGRRNNPLVPLPDGTDSVLDSVTGVIVTHEHPDHFDKPACSWIRERHLPVWANAVDVPNLKRKGLDVRELSTGQLDLVGMEVVRSKHGKGLLGWLMGPVAGYYLAFADEPSLYLTGDTILTEQVLEAVERLQPDIIVAPAGAANMGLGGDILFSVDELVQLIRKANGTVILNHLEALDHCPTTREELKKRMAFEGLQDGVRVPEDGEEIVVNTNSSTKVASTLQSRKERPGMQKWITAMFAGS